MRRHTRPGLQLRRRRDRDRRDRRRLLPRVRRLLPFTGSPFVLKAVFTCRPSCTSRRRCGSPASRSARSCRSSGSPGSSNAAVVTMDIDKNGLPIHADATARIRSRIFLEGNFYVDLHPGTPDAPIAVARAPRCRPPNTRARSSSTACWRRSDSTRAEPADAAAGVRRIAGHARRPRRQDATQDPIVRGLTGGQALNLSLKYSAGAFRASAIVNQALLGIQPHDLSGVVSGQRAGVQGPRAEPATQLSSLVTRSTRRWRRWPPASRISARRSRCCRRCCGAPRPSDTALDASFAPTQQFASDSCRASSSSTRRSARRCRGSPRPRRWSPSRSSAACWPT